MFVNVSIYWTSLNNTGDDALSFMYMRTDTDLEQYESINYSNNHYNNDKVFDLGEVSLVKSGC